MSRCKCRNQPVAPHDDSLCPWVPTKRHRRVRTSWRYKGRHKFVFSSAAFIEEYQRGRGWIE